MVAYSGSRFEFWVPGGTLNGFQGIQFFDISSSVEIAGGFLFDNIAVTPVPEPSTFILLFPALVTLAVFAGKREHRPSAS